MIYESLYGGKPFPGGSYHELLRAMTDDEFVPQYQEPMAGFFKKAIARDRESRFSSAGEMSRALLASLHGAETY